MTVLFRKLWTMDLQKNKKNVTLNDLMPLISEKLDMGGTVRLPSTGMSMAPLFRHMRDEVVLEAAEGKPSRKYDMILYRRDNGQYVLHRIVGHDEGGYILRGDAQYVSESPVRPDQVIARVIRYKRNGREHTCGHAGYRLYVVLWVKSFPVRRVCAAVKRRLGGLYRRSFPGGEG